MRVAARQSLGILVLWLFGCSQVENDLTHAAGSSNGVGGTTGDRGVADSIPNAVVTSGTGGATSDTSAATVTGGASVIATDVTTGVTVDPPPNGGAPSTATLVQAGTTGSTEGGNMSVGGGALVGQGGSVGRGGAAPLATAGAAGASAISTETLSQVITGFCALSDVQICSPDCLVVRRAEATYYPNCRELYRLLMACQVELAVAQRSCVNGTVTSPKNCTTEDDAYWACVEKPQA